MSCDLYDHTHRGVDPYSLTTPISRSIMSYENGTSDTSNGVTYWDTLYEINNNEECIIIQGVYTEGWLG